ncbi:hypothetical protein [Nocardia anaemiae]|uniref:hypothetical protein n=1 Tax=Nocardia anaemiae TaxID=263910 RepID=UPI0007A3FD8B|nr:hypothetical protein [Nocardia anaemiae]
MTAEGPWEIPPLDDAPDIARATEPQPGITLADARNWPGFVLLIIGGLVAIAAAVIGAVGFPGTAFIFALVAIAASLTGIAVVLVERRRPQPRTPDQPAPWQPTVPPGA